MKAMMTVLKQRCSDECKHTEPSSTKIKTLSSIGWHRITNQKKHNMPAITDNKKLLNQIRLGHIIHLNESGVWYKPFYPYVSYVKR